MPATHLPADNPRELSGPPRPRQCGRCRLFFVGDASSEPSDIVRWWACPECRIKLFGDAVWLRRRATPAGSA